MKINKKFFIALCLLFSSILISCNARSHETSQSLPKTLDEVKKYYKEQLVHYNKIDQHGIFVAYRDDVGMRYDIVDLEQQEIYRLPIMAGDLKFESVLNESEIVFLADGTNYLNSYEKFPYLVRMIKSRNGYRIVEEEKWNSVGTNLKAVAGKKGSVYDIAVNFDGIQIMFEPIEEDASNFYAAYTDIPETSIYFDENKRMVIAFEDALISDKIQPGLLISIKNHYIQYIQFQQENNRAKMTIILNENAETYGVLKRHLEEKIPIFEIKFK